VLLTCIKRNSTKIWALGHTLTQNPTI